MRHEFREQTRVADPLAKEGFKGRCFEKPNVLVVPPMFSMDVVWADISGTTFIRHVKDCNITNYIVDYSTINGSAPETTSDII